MSPWCIRRYVFLLLIIEQFNVNLTTASWPFMNMSNIQLLGLFPDPENTSKPTAFSTHARAMFQAAVVLSHRYNMRFEGEFISWQSVQTGGLKINALRSTCEVVSSSNIVGIVGPAFSREAHLIASLAGSIGIPDISQSATNPDLSDRNAYPTFYRTVSSDNAAAIAIGRLFIRYAWLSSIIVYQNDAFGSGGAKSISQVFSDIGVAIRQTIVFDIATKTIRGDLKSLIASSSTRIVVLWADPVHTALVIQAALDNDVLGPQYMWISSSSIPLNSFNQNSLPKLLGMLTVEPVIGSLVVGSVNRTLLDAAYSIWQEYEPETFVGAADVDYYALFAFDATWTLILALRQLCPTPKNSSSLCVSLTNATNCFDRRLTNSRAFLNVINKLAFLGVSGPVQFSINTTDRITGIYYVAQNAQPSTDGLSFIPVLKYSDSTNWDTVDSTQKIIWPGNTTRPPDDRVALENVRLRIALLESPPFTTVTYGTDANGNSTMTFTGYMPELIDLLQAKMRFIPQLILAPSSKTYTEVIQDVTNDVYDMLVGDVAITAARREIVSFSNSIFDNSLCIVMRQTVPDKIDLLAYMRPFKRDLWLLLLGCTIYAGVVVCCLERQENDALKNRSISSLFFMGVWYAIGVIIGYGVDFHVRTAAGRLLTAGLYIVSIVFVATYTANLASYLTISKSQDSVSGVDDIRNGKLTFNRIGIRVGTSMEDYYLRQISGGNRNFYPIRSLQQQFTSLLNGTVDATFMDSGIAEYVTNNIYCNLTIIGADFDKAAFGIVMPKQWIHVQDVDVAILSLRESGALDNLRKKWFSSQICPDTYVIPSALGIESLAGLFLTFAVISILAVLLFLWRTRDTIKDYLLQAAHRRNLLTHISISMIRKASKRS